MPAVAIQVVTVLWLADRLDAGVVYVTNADNAILAGVEAPLLLSTPLLAARDATIVDSVSPDKGDYQALGPF